MINKLKTVEEKLYRKTSISTGVFFLVGTITGIISLPLLESISTPLNLELISANFNRVTAGALLVAAMGIACTSIAVSLYPVLKRHNQGLAAGALAFRSIEGGFDILGAVIILGILALSGKTGNGRSVDLVAEMLAELRILVRDVGMYLCWNAGALCYYILFFRSNLIPHWLSLWGIAGIGLAFFSCLLFLFGLYPPFSTIHVLMNIPIAVQEMILALWLIVKGFDRKYILPESAT